MRQQLPPENVIVWGESLGGAVATHVASRNPCSHLILMCTFASIPDVITHSNLHWAKPLVPIISCFTETLQSKDKIKQVSCPVVILHSQEDEIIPFANSQILYNNIAHGRKKFIEIEGGHANPKISPYVLEEMFKFCQMEVIYDTHTLDILNDIQKADNRHMITEPLTDLSSSDSESRTSRPRPGQQSYTHRTRGPVMTYPNLPKVPKVQKVQKVPKKRTDRLVDHVDRIDISSMESMNMSIDTTWRGRPFGNSQF